MSFDFYIKRTHQCQCNIVTCAPYGKVLDDQTIRLKARTAPHGNKSGQKLELRSDFSSCFPIELRVLLPTAALSKWCVTKMYVKAAFPQSGPTSRDVYLILWRNRSNSGKVLRLMFTAVYGLVNEKAKFQVQSD